MGLCMRILRLSYATFKKHWIVLVWTATCSFIFYADYMHYKTQPQYYYNRRMLGLGLCVSRGSAAVLTVSCSCLVLPMCRALNTALTAGCTRVEVRDAPTNTVTRPLFAALIAPLTSGAKTTHIMIAVSVVGTSVVHTMAHLANAVNFSRHFSKRFPEINVASHKDESPVYLLVMTVPGVTGLLMLLILVLLVMTSTGRVRRKHYNLFYYTHQLGLVFFFLLLIHPLSGVLKEQKNVESHFPGCLMPDDVYREKDRHEPNTKRAQHQILHSTFQNSRNENRLHHHKPQVDFNQQELQAVPDHSQHKGYDISELDSHGYPEPADYGFPEPIDYGYPEPMDYGYPEPTDYGYQEYRHDEEYGFPEPTPEWDFSRYNNDLSRSNTQSSYAHVNQIHNVSASYKEKGRVFEAPFKMWKKKFFRRKPCHHQPEFGAMTSRSWMWVTLALLTWMGDWMLRSWRRRKAVEVVEAVEHPCNVMQLTLRKSGFVCAPGQYVLVQCPAVSVFEWHPFTVTFPPTQHSPDTFTIFMQARGDWSEQVNAIFRQNIKSYPSRTCPKSNVEKVHTVIHCNAEDAGSPLRYSYQVSANSSSLPSPHHHLSSPAFTSNHEHPSTHVSSQIVNKITHKSLSCTVSSSNLSNTIPSDRFYVNFTTVNGEPIVGLKSQRPVSWHPQIASSAVSNHSNCQEINVNVSNVISDTSEPQGQCRNNYSASHINFNHHSLAPGVCRHISCNNNPLENVGSLHSLKTHDVDSKNSANVSSVLKCKQHSARRKCRKKKREEVNGTAADSKTIIYIPRTSDVRLYVDGPFSSPCEGMMQYPVVVGAAGGMGITPLAATLTHMLHCRSSWPRRVHIVWAVRNPGLLYTFAPLLSSLLTLCWETKAEDRVELSLHLTNKKDPQLLKEMFAKDHPALLPRIQHGRPQWKHLFRVWRDSYDGQTVGVFACGPVKLRRQVKRHCLSAVSRGTAFYYHQETFS